MVGYVSKYQVPMIMTFSNEDAEFICDSLAYSINQASEIIDFFMFQEDEDNPWGEEY